MITAFEAYNIFQSIKLHFQSEDYDAVKYNFQTRTKQETFEKRKDKIWYVNTARKYPNRTDMIHFFLANILTDTRKLWISGCNEDNYNAWKKRTKGITYNFTQDCKKLNQQFKLKELIQGDIPPVVNEYLGERITLETLTIFNLLTGCVDNISDNVLFEEVKLVVKKYTPFIKIDLNRMATIAKNIFQN